MAHRIARMEATLHGYRVIIVEGPSERVIASAHHSALRPDGSISPISIDEAYASATRYAAGYGCA